MPIIRLSDLDVFAFLDADSDEAKTYQTYFGYWDCLARAITDAFGESPNEGIAEDLRGRRSYRRLSSTQFHGDDAVLRGLRRELDLYQGPLRPAGPCGVFFQHVKQPFGIHRMYKLEPHLYGRAGLVCLEVPDEVPARRQSGKRVHLRLRLLDAVFAEIGNPAI